MGGVLWSEPVLTPSGNEAAFHGNLAIAQLLYAPICPSTNDM
jgi:hypothetical protein